MINEIQPFEKKIWKPDSAQSQSLPKLEGSANGHSTQLR